MDLNHAIEKHTEWKLKFRTAISKHEKMDAETISKDDRCDLGRWLHGEAKGSYGRLASHAECVARHAAFHVEAGKVARTINAGKFDAAEALLGAGTGFTLASGAVAVAINRLKREASL